MSFFTKEQEEVLYKLHRNDEDYAENIEFLKGSLQNLIESKIAPKAFENDQQEKFCEENFRLLGETGYLTMPFSEENGGLNTCFSYYAAGLESLSKADSGFTLGVAIHGTVCDGIAHFASKELKDLYLEDLINGRKIAAFGLSESDSGSDAKSMNTSYTFDEGKNEYILNGSKFWITNGMSADVFFVMARGPQNDISSFIVTKGNAGEFQQNKIEDKVGVRGSNTAELVFNDYRVPANHLVGEEGAGFKYAMRMLNGGRVTIAAWSTGVAQAGYEKLIKYAHERKLFGRYLKDLDNLKKELAEMAIEIAASRELSYNAAFYKESSDIMRHAAIAKVKASETAVSVGERAIELAGGYGYLKESTIERHLRDALLGRIGEGANELLKIVVIPRALYKAFEQKPITASW